MNPLNSGNHGHFLGVIWRKINFILIILCFMFLPDTTWSLSITLIPSPESVSIITLGTTRIHIQYNNRSFSKVLLTKFYLNSSTSNSQLCTWLQAQTQTQWKILWLLTNLKLETSEMGLFTLHKGCISCSLDF